MLRFPILLVESFTSNVGEKLLDFVIDTGKSSINFKLNLQNLQRNSKRLSNIASDVETQIKNQELQGKKKRKREVEKWLDMVQDLERDFLELEKKVEEKGFVSRFVSGDRVSKLNTRVERLIEQRQHFDDILVLDACEATGEPFLTTKLIGKMFEEMLERILECLVVDKVSQIGIHGISGVGKTALAMHIHNLILDKNQDRVYWVRVSQEFTTKKLQDEIAEVIGLSLSHENVEEKRAAALNRVLTQKKDFVLILDDVWEDISLERVGYPIGVDGCRLIITTRSLKVCRQIGCQHIFELKKLEMDEAWILFKEKLVNEAMLSPQIREIAKLMTKECDGLPQRIITLAQSMHGETQIQEWRNALAELGGNVMT